jgi:hypothetical protein
MNGASGSRYFCVDILTFSIEHHEMLRAHSLHHEQRVHEDIIGRYRHFTWLPHEVQFHTFQALLLLSHRASAITKFHTRPTFPGNEQKIELNVVDFTYGNSHGRHEPDQTVKTAEPSILHQYCSYKFLVLTPAHLQIWKI